MLKKVSVSILGGGRIGKVHTNSIVNFVSEMEVKYVADQWEGAREWVEKLGLNFTTDIAKAINDRDVDAVLICSSTDTHVKYIKMAAAAKKDIFCEKPIDHDLDRIYEAIKAVEENGVKFQIGFNRRFDHNFKAIRDAIKSGKIGEVHLINITSRDPGAPPIEYIKVSGGMFMDMTIHDFDMVRFLAGSDVEEVYAKGAVLIDPKIGEAGDIDSAVVVLKFKNGAIGIINNSRQAVYGYDQRAEVFGSKGAIEIKNDTPSTAILSVENGVIADKPLHFFMDRYTQSYVDEIKEFADAVINNKETPATVADGLEAVRIAKAAMESMRKNIPIKL